MTSFFVFFYEILASGRFKLLGQIERSFGVFILCVDIGSGAEQQFGALWLVVDGAVVQCRVTIGRHDVDVGRILHQKVDYVQRVTPLPADRHV